MSNRSSNVVTVSGRCVTATNENMRQETKDREEGSSVSVSSREEEPLLKSSLYHHATGSAPTCPCPTTSRQPPCELPAKLRQHDTRNNNNNNNNNNKEDGTVSSSSTTGTCGSHPLLENKESGSSSNSSAAFADLLEQSHAVGRLYDRHDEEQALVQAYHRNIGDASASYCCPQELVLITGSSGTGKSALARSLRRHVQAHGGYFMAGKFDQFLMTQQQQQQQQQPLTNNARPFATLDDACKDLMQQVSPQHWETLQQQVRQAVGSEASLLVETLPSLRDLLQGPGMAEDGNINASSSVTTCSATTFTVNNNYNYNYNYYNSTKEKSSTNSQKDDDDKLSIVSTTTCGTTATTTTSSTDPQRRIATVFRRFMRALASPHRPIVLLLDDLQWADIGSLNLIRAILYQQTSPATTNSNSTSRQQQQQQQQQQQLRGLLLVGTCRGNEVGFHDPLAVMLRNLEDKAGTNITEIKVRNLSPSSLGQLISDLLLLQNNINDKNNNDNNDSPTTSTSTTSLDVVNDRCQALAEIVHQQTQGNAFFALQFLRKLQQDGLVFQNSSAHRGGWNWNIGEIAQAVAIANHQTNHNHDNAENTSTHQVVSLLEHQLRQLPEQTQEILKVAACLGNEFEHAILCKAVGPDITPAQVEQALHVAVELGYATLETATNSNTNSANNDYADNEQPLSSIVMGRFIHDKHQEAAYSLIPKDQKAAFHLGLARNIAGQMTPEEFSENLLLIVNHGIFGNAEIDDTACRNKLAELCLEAGQKVARSSAFAVAEQYFETGTRMLSSPNTNYWRDHYELSLDLHNAAAEMAFCRGDHEKADTFVESITKNARRFEDQVIGYRTQLLCLTASGKYVEGVTLGFKVSKKLGEPFPKKMGRVGFFLDFLKTRMALRGKSEADILALPRMTNYKALGVMSILHIIYPMLLRCNAMLAPLLGFRMVRISLRHGLSPLSSIGFGFFASVLSRLGVVDDAVKYGQLALVIMERFPSSGLSAKTLCTVWGDSMPHKISYRNCIEPMIEARRLSMAAGESSSAAVAGFCHCALALSVGEPLSSIENSSLHYLNTDIEYGQVLVSDFHKVIQQGCLNLQGRTARNPLVLTGPVMNEEEMLQRTSSENSIVLWLYMFKYFIATYLHEFEYADSLSQKIRKNMKAVVLPLLATVQGFLEGLVAAASSRQSKKKRAVAAARLKELKKAAKNNPESLRNKVALLEGELARASGHYDVAMTYFGESIKLSLREGYIHEQALACERAGRMLLDCGKEVEATRYLNTSRTLYMQWGAQTKVDQVDQLLATRTTLPKEERLAVFLQTQS